MSDRPLCDRRTLFQLREDYINLQSLYNKLEGEREEVGIAFQREKKKAKKAEKEKTDIERKWKAAIVKIEALEGKVEELEKKMAHNPYKWLVLASLFLGVPAGFFYFKRRQA
eukprot:jgi/Bigna1/139091/aug1.48_g13799